ncbi:MAG: AAA family ATPase [Candidatus Competibacterales bacterium]
MTIDFDLATPQGIAAAFLTRDFIAGDDLATALFLAATLERPLLLEGPPGVGKTEVAKLWAEVRGTALLRLQCYEGLDEAKALYEWSYGKQMLYAQLLRDKATELTGDAPTLLEAIARLKGQADEFFSVDFLAPRPLLQAILSEEPVVLLIDEVDRSDEAFEAFLLEILADFQVSVPELGTLSAHQRPQVILTSNDTRDLSDALRRRCLFCYLDYPTPEVEAEILRRRVPTLEADLARRVAAFIRGLRGAELRKTPGISEAIDWALALVAVGAVSLTPKTLRQTLGALVKHRDDLERILANPKAFQ